MVGEFCILQNFAQKTGAKNFTSMHWDHSRPPVVALEKMVASFDSYHLKSELAQFTDQFFAGKPDFSLAHASTMTR